MARPKKVVKKEEKVEVKKDVNFTISEITNDLGRGDLNELRDKINEIIRYIRG